ncbi:uncharacterized protein LOC110709956 [Chenopodium quinoa]|uniref:uncharacterized protein LOC110709956 n=1 Tax=Chenopodium quinoa TaxID=63459 RepID=UPI000B76EDC5|nr:uncharacterized protein LOC110709956 [Chenopodium quinoa]
MGVPLDTICGFYHRHVEIVAHIFQQCEFTSLIRMSHPLVVLRTLTLDCDFNVWLTEAVTSFATSKDWSGLDCLLAFLWAIWLTRNNLRFRSEVYSPAGIFATAATWVARSKEARDLSNLSQPSCPPGFGPSLPHFIRLNDPTVECDICLTFDGSWSDKDHRAGMGWYLSSDLSSPPIGGGAQAGFSSSALHVELLACLLGLRHTWDQGYSSVRVFTDCCQVRTLLWGQMSDSISVRPLGFA